MIAYSITQTFVSSSLFNDIMLTTTPQAEIFAKIWKYAPLEFPIFSVVRTKFRQTFFIVVFVIVISSPTSSAVWRNAEAKLVNQPMALVYFSCHYSYVLPLTCIKTRKTNKK